MYNIFNDFLSDNNQSTLVILGNSGSGKTISVNFLAETLAGSWKNYLSDSLRNLKPGFFPILVRPALQKWNLSELQNSMKQILEKYELTEKTLKSVPIVLILDGIDECKMDGDLRSIFSCMGCEEIPGMKYKTIVTCKQGKFSEDELCRLLSRTTKEDTATNTASNAVLITTTSTTKTEPNETGSMSTSSSPFSCAYVLPFNTAQILEFSKKTLCEDSQRKFQENFLKYSHVRELLRNPFLENLFVKSWDTISRNNPETITRWKIFECYIGDWIRSNRDLLSGGVQSELAEFQGSDLEFSFKKYASRVAFRVFLNRGISMHLTECGEIAGYKWSNVRNIVNSDAKNNFLENSHKFPSSELPTVLDEDFSRIMMLRLHQFESECPLGWNSNGHVEFSHKLFFEYFCAERILLEAEQPENFNETAKKVLSERDLKEEPEILEFISEGWDKNVHDVLLVPLSQVMETSATDTTGRLRENCVNILNANKLGTGVTL